MEKHIIYIKSLCTPDNNNRLDAMIDNIILVDTFFDDNDTGHVTSKIKDFCQTKYNVNVVFTNANSFHLAMGNYIKPISDNEFSFYCVSTNGNTSKVLHKGIFYVVTKGSDPKPIGQSEKWKKIRELSSANTCDSNERALHILDFYIEKGLVSKEELLSLLKIVLFYGNLKVAKRLYELDSSFDFIIQQNFCIQNHYEDAQMAGEEDIVQWLSEINTNLVNMWNTGSSNHN